MGEQEALRAQLGHLAHHLSKHRAAPSSSAALIVAVVGVVVAGVIAVVAVIIIIAVAMLPAALDAKPIELNDRPVLPVPDHGGLNHLPEGRLLGRCHQ